MEETPEIRPSISSSDQSLSQDSLVDQTKVPNFGGLTLNGNAPVLPFMYPALVPGLYPLQQEQEQLNHGPGLYAVPVLPFMQPIGGIPSNALIPFTYNIPTEHSSAAAREVNGEQGQPGQHPQHPHEAGPQRHVVRRFQVAIQIDLLLILKLVALIFLFNQDGSKQRLAILVFFASVIYLYQTGALAPLMRWLAQGMPRAAAPPQPPRAAAGADNLPAAGAPGNENVIAGGQPLGENENQQVNDGNMAVRNENAQEPGQGEGENRWWAVVKEFQIIVFGFITSLLPGYHNLD